MSTPRTSIRQCPVHGPVRVPVDAITICRTSTPDGGRVDTIAWTCPTGGCEYSTVIHPDTPGLVNLLIHFGARVYDAPTAPDELHDWQRTRAPLTLDDLDQALQILSRDGIDLAARAAYTLGGDR